MAPSSVLPQPKYQVSHLEASGPNHSGVVVFGPMVQIILVLFIDFLQAGYFVVFRASSSSRVTCLCVYKCSEQYS